MAENSTYSTCWPLFDSRKIDKNFRYRASFGLVPRKGENMVVYEGMAFSNQDIRQLSVVVKGFRNYSGNKNDCKMYELCNAQGNVVAERFNNRFEKSALKIRFVVPAVTEVNERAKVTYLKKFKKDEAVVFEEKLKGQFCTFVDKRGKTSENCELILEAFCHFSLHASNGRFVICGLKGVQRKDLSEFILTNPTIHSTDGYFGPKDKRDAGILDFKNNHKCNQYCNVCINEVCSESDKSSDEC